MKRIGIAEQNRKKTNRREILIFHLSMKLFATKVSSTHVTNQFIYFSIKELVLDVKHLLICFSER